jgi:hypothetical protein
MTQKIDLSVGRAEVLVLELPALFSALGQLRQALNAALGTFQAQTAKLCIEDSSSPVFCAQPKWDRPWRWSRWSIR